MYWKKLLAAAPTKKSKKLKSQDKKKKTAALTLEPNKNTRRAEIVIQFSQPNRELLHLTLREAECLQHIFYGLTLKDTANQLILSVRSVEFYFSNIKKKMGCTKKSEVIRLLYDSNFVSQIEKLQLAN